MYRDAANHVPTNIAFGNFSDIKRHRPWLRTFFLKAEQPAYINLVGQNKVTSFLRLKEVSLSSVLWSLGVSCFFLFILVPSWAAAYQQIPPFLTFFAKATAPLLHLKRFFKRLYQRLFRIEDLLWRVQKAPPCLLCYFHYGHR